MGGPWEDYQKTESGPWEDYAVSTPQIAPMAPQAEQPKGFFSKVNDSLVKRGVNIADDLKPKGNESMIDTLVRTPGRTLRTVGQTAGLVNDVIGHGISSVASAVTPDSLKDVLTDAGKSILKTDFGKKLISGAQSVEEAYKILEQKYPYAVKNAEAIANIGGLVGGGVIAKTAGKEVAPTMKAAKDLAQEVATKATLKSPDYYDKAIDIIIENGIKKGIRPSVVGKSNAGQVKAYYDKAKTAVKDIIEASPGKMPETLEEMSNAVRTTKAKLYEGYHGMAETAENAGSMVPLTGIRRELLSVIDEPNIRNTIKEAAGKVLKDIDSYDEFITPTKAEELLASFNAETKGFWKNPNPNSTQQAVMTERTAHNLRKTIDGAIENYRGPGYQDLKKRYGALTTIEKEVTDRATVDARKNLKGFFDITDVATSSAFIHGLMTMNPSVIVPAAGGWAAKNWIKKINDPNRIIKGMFGDAEKLMKRKEMAMGKQKPDMSGDVSGIRPTPEALPMPERGFTMKGEPYGDDVINASFTSRTRPLLEQPRVDETKLLPAGQGFAYRDVAPSSAYSTELAKQLLPLLQRKALPAGQGFTLSNPISEEEIIKKILELRGMSD
jgi:hypothetical protein